MLVFNVNAITNGENALNVLGQTTFTSGSAATTQGRMNAPTGVLLVVVPGTTITYTYDPLYRLTAADYSGGLYFHYTYDAVGNPVSLRSRGERPADGGDVGRVGQLCVRHRSRSIPPKAPAAERRG